MADLSVAFKFCFLFRRNVAETVVIMKIAYKESIMGKLKYASSLFVIEKV